MTGSPLVNVNELCLKLGRVDVLDKVSFTLPSNQFIGVLGPNGAGKSSLLRCLYGFYQSYSGKVEFAGQAVADYSRQQLAKKIAVVTQQQPSFSLLVHEVIELGLLAHTPPWQRLSAAQRLEVDKVIADVGLSQYQYTPYQQLSGGEQQRVQLARAMVQKPTCLILDEPTAHLDIQHQIELMALVKRMHCTVIASLHDINLASALCDQLLVLDGGKLVAQGTPEQVITQPMLREIFAVNAQVTLSEQRGKSVPVVHYDYFGDSHV